jgi:hypothetical protein
MRDPNVTVQSAVVVTGLFIVLDLGFLQVFGCIGDSVFLLGELCLGRNFAIDASILLSGLPVRVQGAVLTSCRFFSLETLNFLLCLGNVLYRVSIYAARD